MATVTINQGAIRAFFNARPFGERSQALRVSEGRAKRIADAIVAQAKLYASGTTMPNGKTINERSGDLKNSLKPIVRHDPTTGGTRVGVGSTIEYAKYLEEGTPPHIIPVKNRPRGGDANIHHPGIKTPFAFLQQAVDSVRPFIH